MQAAYRDKALWAGGEKDHTHFQSELRDISVQESEPLKNYVSTLDDWKSLGRFVSRKLCRGAGAHSWTTPADFPGARLPGLASVSESLPEDPACGTVYCHFLESVPPPRLSLRPSLPTSISRSQRS